MESIEGQSAQTTIDPSTEELPEGIPPEQLTTESELEVEVDDSARGQVRKLPTDLEVQKETHSLEEHVDLQKQKQTDQAGAPAQSKDTHETKTAPTPVAQDTPGGEHEQHVHSNTATASEPEIKPEQESPLATEPELVESMRAKRTHEAKADSATSKQRAEESDHAPKESEDDNVDSHSEPRPLYQSAQARVEEAQVTGLLCTMQRTFVQDTSCLSSHLPFAITAAVELMQRLM